MSDNTPVESNPATADGGQGPTLTPSANSDYSLAVRTGLDAWLGDDGDDDDDIDEGAEAGEEEAGEESAEGEEPEAEVEEVEDEDEGDASDPEAPEDEEDAEDSDSEEEAEEADPEEEEAAEEAEAEETDDDQPKDYAVVTDDDAPAALPKNVKFRYRADGADREYTLDEVIERAKLGENYNRRSQDLANQGREFEQQKQQWQEGATQQLNTAWNEFVQTARRFAEDPDFREEFLDEWERINSDPKELERTLKAQQAEQLERELAEYKRREAAEFSQRVWGTVDTIIQEAQQDFKYANPERVRARFQALYQTRGQEVLREATLREIMREEHEAVASVVEAERERALAEVNGQVRRQAVKTAVAQQNKQTAKAVKREQVAKKVPATPSRAAAKAEKPPKTFEDSRKKLQSWADDD